MKLYKPQFVALVILAFFASGYVANMGLLLQKPIWQEPVRTYKFTPEPGHDVEVMIGGSGDTQTVRESFYHTGNTTWKVPAGVTSIGVELWGGGGAGGGLTTNTTVCRGGGGAGGQYVASSSFPVTAGNSYTIAVGAGGTGSTGSGAVGASSTFTYTGAPIFVAVGGAGGQSYEAGAAAGTGSTTNASGTTIYAGGNGSAGGTGTTGGAGGGGAADTGTGNNASGNTGGAFKTFGGGEGRAGLSSTGAGGTPNTIILNTSFNSSGGATPSYGYGGGGSGSANMTTVDSTDRPGGAGGAGGARITYTNNTAYLHYSGYYSAGSTSVTPFYVQGSTSTDLLLAVIVHKHASTTVTTPALWTKIAEIEGGHRPSYLTADQGAVVTTVFAREATSTVTGQQSFSISSGNSSIGKMYRFIKSPGTTWEYATSTDADNVAGTAWSATTTNNLSIQPDDIIFAVSGVNGDAATFSAEAFSAISGITFGEVTGEMLDHAYTGGLDTRLVTYMARVYSGTTSTAPIVYRMTASGTSTNRPLGSTVFIVIRQTAGGTTPVQVQDVIFFD